MNREAFLSLVGTPKIEPVEGVAGVFVRSVPVSKILELRGESDAEQSYRLLVASLCDEAGETFLTDDDLPKFRAGSGIGQRDFKAMVDAALRVNQLDKPGFDEAKKNSPTPSSSSPTG